MMAVIEPGTQQEQIVLARWIRRGRDLIAGTSAMGDSYLDPNVKRDAEKQKLTEDYVKYDHEVADELPHLKGRFRWDLEKYYRDHFGPYFPKE